MHGWIGFEMELIIFIGLQASGKSTFFHTHFAATHEYVSKDVLRNNKRPNRRQMQLIERAFEAGHSVVVDNTNPTDEARKPLLAAGAAYGAQITRYYFETQVRTAIKRTKRRGRRGRAADE